VINWHKPREIGFDDSLLRATVEFGEAAPAWSVPVLLPCRLCGGAAFLRLRQHYTDRWVVGCAKAQELPHKQRCRAPNTPPMEKGAAVKAWNDRQIPPS